MRVLRNDHACQGWCGEMARRPVLLPSLSKPRRVWSPRDNVPWQKRICCN